MKWSAISKTSLVAFVLGLVGCAATTGPSIEQPPLTGSGVPAVTIVSPTEEEIFPSEKDVAIQLAVENFSPAQGNVHLVIDEKAPVMVPWNTLQSKATKLQEGSHILRAYLVDTQGIPLTNPEAFAYRNYTSGIDNNLWSILPDEPVMTITEPRQGSTVKGPQVRVAALLHNYAFGPEGGYIRLSYFKDGGERQVAKMKSTEPLLLDLEPGSYLLSAELYSWSGEALTSNWTWQNIQFVVQ